MTRYSSLDEQLDVLNALHISSARTLDSFADTSKAIADRARRIEADVQLWEMAQDNIASTIEEMSRAARCYHPPPTLRLVLARKEKNPEVLCKCIDYLAFTDNYLVTHPSNPYGDQIASNLSTQLTTVVGFAEDVVKEAFITSMQKKRQQLWRPGESEMCEASTFAGTTTTTATTTNTLTPVLIHNPDALRGIDRVVRRLGENFDRTNVVSVEVKELLSERMLRHINTLIDISYKEEEIQPYHPVTARHGTVPMRKHYQKGGHRLLGISKKARQLVSEVGECLKKYVLEPLDNSFDVVEMPGELGTRVFDCIQRKCFDAVKIDHTVFSDPTRMFVMSRGEDIGLWGETRHFRDTIFIGLDLLEELWKWKTLFTDGLPGENHVFIDHVESEVERFLFEVRYMLDDYVNCKGALDAKLLKEHTNTLHRTEWLPPLDCTTHMSATNQVYLHKVLLTSYFGAVKLTLYGSLLNPAAEEEALQAVENYMMRCVLGTLLDLGTIAKVALELQADTASEGGHLSSSAVFMLNNISFLIESYRNEACFYQRRLPMCNLEETLKNTKKELPSVPIVSNIISILEDEKGRFVDEFAASWSKCFPPVNSDPNLANIGPQSGELRKPQRMAVKFWYRDVAEALTRKISACRTLAVLDPSQRNALIEAAVAAVRNGFQRFEALLQGRTWSRRPLKWMVREVEQWEYMLSKSF